MKKGFLLPNEPTLPQEKLPPPPDVAEEAGVPPQAAEDPCVTPLTLPDEILDRECPVCLEETTECVMLPCRHSICKNCTLQLWEVQQSANSSGTLMCPLCRREHTVPQGVDVFLQEGEMRGGRRPPSARAGSSTPRAPSSLDDLSMHELKAIAESLGLQHGQMLERREITQAVAEKLAGGGHDAACSTVLLRSLPPKSLTAILRSRKIPYADCMEKEELVHRVELTARGSCMQLPPKILKLMLAELGLANEVYVDKANLARRVMAARALAQVKLDVYAPIRGGARVDHAGHSPPTRLPPQGAPQQQQGHSAGQPSTQAHRHNPAYHPPSTMPRRVAPTGPPHPPDEECRCFCSIQ